MMRGSLSWSPIRTLAPSLAIVASVFVLGHLIPLAGTAEAEPFVQTGRTSGCLHSWAWMTCWTSYPDPRHLQIINVLWAVALLLVGLAWTCRRRLTHPNVIRQTEQ